MTNQKKLMPMEQFSYP